jgi:hypothetical protein
MHTFVAQRGADLADMVLQTQLVHLVEPDRSRERNVRGIRSK